MKVVTPEISWHNRDPIYSIDFQYVAGHVASHVEGHVTRLVTSGTDKNIRIWSISEGPDGKMGVEFLSNLDRHSRAVNVVRFSPDGQTLASAGDDSVVMLWKLQAVCQQGAQPMCQLFQDDDVTNNKETWTVQKILRGHLEDIYDLCWSPDCERMITGSVDNSAIIWDVKKGKPMSFLKESTSFIQGVAWDPRNQYVATLSCDRRCRIYSVATQQCLHTIQKMSLPCQPSDNGEQPKPKYFKMFHDDTMKSFFRRLSFSSDGEVLVTPAGLVELAERPDDVTSKDDVIVKDQSKEAKAEVNATFLFSRTKLTKPAAYLPYPPKATVAVRCCPVLFQLREVPRQQIPADADVNNLQPWEKYQTLFCLPYRVVFAVATEDCVLVYDSQQTLPITCISKIHYHQLSDLAWSQDGRTLVVASTDGYCSIVTFDPNELGEVYTPPEVEKAASEESSEKNEALMEPAFKSPELLCIPSVERVGEDTMDLHLVLDDSEEEMDTAAPPAADNETNAKFRSENNSVSLLGDNDDDKMVPKADNNVDTEKAPHVVIGGTNEQSLKSDPSKPRRIAFTTIRK